MSVLKLNVNKVVGVLLFLLCSIGLATNVVMLELHSSLDEENINFLIDEGDDDKEYNHAVKVHGNADIYIEKKTLSSQDNDLGKLVDEILEKGGKDRTEQKISTFFHPSVSRIHLAIKHKNVYKILTIYQKDGKYIGRLNFVRSIVFNKGHTFYLLDPVGTKGVDTYVVADSKLALFYKKYSLKQKTKYIPGGK